MEPFEKFANINFDNAVLNGGGIKGCAFIGVAKALNELQKLSTIKRFIGSSAGAIFASVIACGMNTEDMINMVYNTDFSLFLDGTGGQIGQGLRLFMYNGLFNGDYFYNWFGDVMEKTTGNKEITLLQVFEKYEKELIITGSNVSTHTIHYFTKDSHPDMPVRLAVRISMSIPVLFIPVKFDNCVWVDGGFLDNYPISFYDPMPFFGQTVGFKLHTNSNPPYTINGVADFAMNLLGSAVDQIELLRKKPDDDLRSVVIPTFDISSLDFSISKQQIATLINSGYNSTMAFFQKMYNIEHDAELLKMTEHFDLINEPSIVP
jgi:predicted acylesterase/phospholipase RssA